MMVGPGQAVDSWGGGHAESHSASSSQPHGRNLSTSPRCGYRSEASHAESGKMWITRESPHRACSKFPQNRGQNRVNITALPTLHTTRIYRKHLNTVWMTMHESN